MLGAESFACATITLAQTLAPLLPFALMDQPKA